MVTKRGDVVGTPYYMAPEQARADLAAISPKTDVWALGLITFELLTGEDYWRASNIAALMQQILAGAKDLPSERSTRVPKTFDAWFLRSCRRDPAERWPSVGAQIDALGPILEPLAGSLAFEATAIAPAPALSKPKANAAAPTECADPFAAPRRRLVVRPPATPPLKTKKKPETSPEVERGRIEVFLTSKPVVIVSLVIAVVMPLTAYTCTRQSATPATAPAGRPAP
jgi:serine/threonine protein kinase